MGRSNKIFVFWGVLVVAIIGLLTFTGFMVKKINNNYGKVEEKLVQVTKGYVDTKFLYPDEGDSIKVTAKELRDNEVLDELKNGEDSCDGYVIVKKDGIYDFKAYIKCDKYKTRGYDGK